MTTWTTPKTWLSEVLTASSLNTHLRDNLNYLHENSIPVLVPGLRGSPDVAGLGGAGTSEEWSTATPGLTWNDTPTTVDSNTTVADHLYISTQSDTTERRGVKNWSAAGAFDARLGKVLVGCSTSVAAASGSFGLLIEDATEANRLALEVIYTFNTRAALVRALTYTSSTYTQRGTDVGISAGLMQYLRITRDASNNCSFYWSANGTLWNFIATQSFTFTVAKIGVIIQTNTAGLQAVADWLRTSV